MKFDNLLVLPFESSDNFVNLPNSILEKLSKNNNITMPYYFAIKTSYGTSHYVGVKEFTATDSTIEVPTWITQNLGVDFIDIELIKKIHKAKYIKIEPLSKDFFNIPENDLALEKSLSNYCILQADLTIEVVIFDIIYKIKILEIKDDENTYVDYAQIINVDLDVEFINNFVKKEEPILPELINSTPIINSTEEINSDKTIKTLDEIRQARLAYYDKILKK